jgi:hypothetical protein
MSLENEVSTARKRIYRDGYDMSFGELASLYEKKELVIDPEYQRLFRWDATKKTRFIESLLLNIPIPPIFVFARKDGVWELVDGLQRVSTVLEFMGLLCDPDGELRESFICDGTTLLPSLEGKRWTQPNDEDGDAAIIPGPLQVSIRRSRIRVEILGQETDPHTKYELFQRLNTGGVSLSEQEIRNCVIISINRAVFDHIRALSQDVNFIQLTDVGEERTHRQYRLELIVRFLVLRHFPYLGGIDVHEYLDQGIIKLCEMADFNWDEEKTSFARTMQRLMEAVGTDAFKKNGRFSIAMYEFISLGLSKLLDSKRDVTNELIRTKVTDASDLPEARTNSGVGIRGTQRLAKFVGPLAEKYFKQ